MINNKAATPLSKSTCAFLALALMALLVWMSVEPKNSSQAQDDDKVRTAEDEKRLAATSGQVKDCYRTLLELSEESRNSSDQNRSAPLAYDRLEFKEVVDEIISGMDIEVSWHENIDPAVEISASYGKIPAISLTSACKSAGATWHVGPGKVFIDGLVGDQTNDQEIRATYELSDSFQTRGGLGRTIYPNAYGTMLRSYSGWVGQSGCLIVEVLDRRQIAVSGYASDHAFFLERTPYATLVEVREE